MSTKDNLDDNCPFDQTFKSDLKEDLNEPYAVHTPEVVKCIKGHTKLMCSIKAETPKAILVLAEQKYPTAIWLPLSQISYIKRNLLADWEESEDYLDEIHVANWLMDKQGLES